LSSFDNLSSSRSAVLWFAEESVERIAHRDGEPSSAATAVAVATLIIKHTAR
jgi:hypothetical protein